MTEMKRDDGEARRDKLSRLYSESAAGYEEVWAPVLLPLSRELLPHLPLESARTVLDGAAGVGTLLPDLKARASRAHVLANDLTPGMLQRARDADGRVTGDLARLPFKDQVFDVCVLAFVLFHLVDPQRGVDEAARVLAAGGSLGTTTWGDENLPPSFEIWVEELEAAGAPPAGTLANDELVDTQEKMQAIFERAGLKPERLWTGEYRVTPTPDEFMEHRIKHGQGRWRLMQLDPESRTTCVERVRRRLESLTAEDFLETSQIVYAVGRKP